MRYHLTEGDRRDFGEVLSPGAKWSYVKDDAELRRAWQPLHDARGEVVLQHANGAVAVLRLDGDVVKQVDVQEGAAALPLLRRHGFQVADEVRAKVRAAFRPGRPFDQAVEEVWPRRQGLREIPAPPGRKRFAPPWSGVLEIDVADDAIRAHRFLVGGDALDAIESALTQAEWSVPAWPGGTIHARTPAEARLFVAVQKGDWVDSRERDGHTEALAATPEGRRVFRFRVDGPASGPFDFGPGTSPCLDPAVLLLFGSTTESAHAHPEKVPADLRPRVAEKIRLAAAGLREATRFAAPGTDLPPTDIYGSKVGTFLRQSQPERFRTANLLAGAARLDALASRWSE